MLFVGHVIEWVINRTTQLLISLRLQNNKRRWILTISRMNHQIASCCERRKKARTPLTAFKIFALIGRDCSIRQIWAFRRTCLLFIKTDLIGPSKSQNESSNCLNAIRSLSRSIYPVVYSIHPSMWLYYLFPSLCYKWGQQDKMLTFNQRKSPNFAPAAIKPNQFCIAIVAVQWVWLCVMQSYL